MGAGNPRARVFRQALEWGKVPPPPARAALLDELAMTPRHNLRIDPERLWSSLMEMARIGATAKGGCNRQALTPQDGEGRALFARWCRETSLEVRTDGIGSMFARWPGEEDLPPVLVGSHLDTQPTGGKFDGVLGVLAALEVVRTLRDTGVRLRRPVEIVNWTNEEGCRFTPVMLGSAVFAGALAHADALAARSPDGARLGDELVRLGVDPSAPVGGHAIDSYLELHIEQGPVLEEEGYDVGFVTGGQGLVWYDAQLRGAESHAGATPMALRRDALVGAAAVIGDLQDLAARYGPHGVATVGRLEVFPNSRNVAPGEARFTIDVRHPDASALARMDQEARAAFERRAGAFRLDGALARVSACDPVAFDPNLLAVIRQEAAALGLSGRDIVSGAGHDAFHMARLAPTAMIFVPCVGGVSHNEAEDIRPDWARAGADLLLRSLIAIANRD